MKQNHGAEIPKAPQSIPTASTASHKVPGFWGGHAKYINLSQADKTMADQDRDISADLWLISAQKEVLILELRGLAHRPNTRGKDADRRRIKRRLEYFIEAEKRIIQQL